MKFEHYDIPAEGDDPLKGYGKVLRAIRQGYLLVMSPVILPVFFFGVFLTTLASHLSWHEIRNVKVSWHERRRKKV